MAGGILQAFRRWLASFRPHPATLAFALLLLAFLLTYGWMAWAGNRAFMPILYDTDVGMFHSVMKHALRGELPRFPAKFTPGVWMPYFFVDHFSPLLFLVLPLWALAPGNVVFGWVQIAAYAGAALLLFWVARLRVGHAGLASVVAVAFLLSPQPGFSIYNHFNSAPFMILFLPWAVGALLTGRKRWYWVAIAGLLLSREDAAVLAAAVGLYAALALRHRWLGVVTMSLAAGYLAFVTQVVFPLLGEGLPYPYVASGYSWLGASPGAVLRTLFTDPLGVVQRLDQMDTLRGLLMHLLPFAFLPFASWRGLIFAATVLYMSFHDNAAHLSYHYSYRAAMLIALGSVEGLHALRQYFHQYASRQLIDAIAALAIASLALGAHIWDGYSPISRHFNRAEFTPGPRERAMRKAMALIPPGARVSASRIYMTYLIPTRDLECTWDRVEVGDGAGTLGLWCSDTQAPVTADYLLLTDEPPDNEKFQRVTGSPGYDVRFHRLTTILLQRREGD